MKRRADQVKFIRMASFTKTAVILRAGIFIFCLSQTGLLLAADIPPGFSGNLALAFSNYQSDYLSRQLSFNGDIGYQAGRNEIGSDFLYNQKTIQLADATPTVLTDKYDANVKWKNYFDDTLYYAYLSPRFRHNQTGYYNYSQALRIGLGKKFLSDGDNFKLSLEAGCGYRTARLQSDEQISENLFTLAEKLSWKLNPALTIVLNIQHEQSAREKYQTAKLSLTNKLTEHFGVVFEYTNTKAYPFETTNHSTEQFTSMGLAYEF